jgi:integrase
VLGKVGKLASLPVPPQLVELLFEWQGLYATGQGRPVERDQPVLVRFGNQPGATVGEPYTAKPCWGRGVGEQAIYSAIHLRASEIGLPELAPHDLRRSYAGVLEDRGVPLRDISALLRHSSIATTEKYLADNPKKWRDSVATAFAGIGRTA